MSDRGHSLALFTDLYELTMAQAYWQSGKTAQATFSLFFRNYPPNRSYFVLAGVEEVLEYLEGLSFSKTDIDFLESTGKFDRAFLEHLAQLRFSGGVRAMPEGSIFFAGEPVIEVAAPVIEAQIAETLLLNQITLQSMLATKASRAVYAAQGRMVVDFGARRAHGIDAANKLARVSYMVGFAGTSNVLAGRLYDIPTFGTMAHSFIECFQSEEEAFRAYANSFPEAGTFLVDTYDTLGGVKRAIAVGKEMGKSRHALRAVRLDSGDLLDLSVKSRALLDEAGLEDVQVFASGGLDEFEVDSLLQAGAPIGGFGVGTKLAVSADAPWVDSAYKLVEYDGRPTLKLSSAKQTAPGPKQVYRYRDQSGAHLRDVLTLATEDPPDEGGEGLLLEVMAGGKREVESQPLQGLRERFAQEFAYLPDRYKALRSPPEYPVRTSAALERVRREVAQQVRKG